MTRRETAALRAAAHAVGWRRDAPDPDAPERGRLDYCEVVVWPETAARLWSRVRDHMPAGAAGINPRFRFFRYGPETVYRRHVDGSWPAGALTPEGEYVTDASDGKLRSKLTLLVYLSEGFEGGATTFYAAARDTPGRCPREASRRGKGARCVFRTETRRIARCTRARRCAPGLGARSTSTSSEPTSSSTSRGRRRRCCGAAPRRRNDETRRRNGAEKTRVDETREKVVDTRFITSR